MNGRNGAALREMPQALLQAIESGVLTNSQLRELIAFEAEEIGLTFDQAVKRARERTLPKDALGSDVQLLVGLLPPDSH